mmetsp:Transcript_21461/g.26391  ORF Transcript_21461/g.26391 Transcript_21461/m.26391 type:complete len:102 (+) Transcript_21461:2012-2317(+)
MLNERIKKIKSGTANNYKLILSDYSMPKMDGPELATAIRALLSASGLPESEKAPYLCCVTAYASPSFEKKALDAGMDRYLTKPISDAQLRLILKKLQIRTI